MGNMKNGLRNKYAVAFTGLAICASILGCSSKEKSTEPTLDQKVQAQPEASSPTEILNRAAETFAKAPGLTPEQREKLSAIYGNTYMEAINIRKEIGQSKSLLFEMVASKDYNSKEVNKLKQKIVSLDQKRLTVMFKALEDVQKVVGYGKDREEIYKHLRDYEIQGHGNRISSF